MPENLKDLGDRATPGEWPAPEHDSSDIGASEWYDIGGIAQHVWREEDAAFIVALVNAYRRGELCRASDAEHYMRLANERRDALATAVARSRREALEEAAGIAESQIDQPDPYSSNAELARADTLNAGLRALASDLRALAATPPEARQTETGWKPMETAHKDGRTILACRDNGCGWGFHLVRWQSGKRGYPWQSATDDNAFPEGRLGYWQPVDPPPPAIGNLEGEGRSHG